MYMCVRVYYIKEGNKACVAALWDIEGQWHLK